MEENYQEINARTIDRWCREGWKWGQPIDHETFEKAQQGKWDVLLTPVRPVPHTWFPDMKDIELLGLASGGAQQVPIFAALGAKCTVFDYSKEQLASEEVVARREAYKIDIVRGDMSKTLPFKDESFELIFHPVSNNYVQNIEDIWREIYRILKPGGVLLSGFDKEITYMFNEEGTKVIHTLPFDPLENPDHMSECEKKDLGIQFSHTLEEQIGGQLKAGFVLTDLYEDIDPESPLKKMNVKEFVATRAMKPLK